MFQRAQPQPSDEDLGSFYGLALPLLMRGVPVEPVQIESAYTGDGAANFLTNYKVLLLTYEGQKPPSPKFHEAISAWVKAGGALVIVDNDGDPYNHATDWWSSGGMRLSTPREDLFRVLGLNGKAEGLHRIGKGVVLYARKSPAALSHDARGAESVRQMTREAAEAVHVEWKESDSLVLRRGPYVIASGLDRPDAKPYTLQGAFVNLFDPHLGVVHSPNVDAGKRLLLLDPKFFPAETARVIAASGKVSDVSIDAHAIAFSVAAIEGRDEGDRIAVRMVMPKTPSKVLVDDQPVGADSWKYSNGMLLLEFPAHAKAQKISVSF
jgi:hypothetical protein